MQDALRFVKGAVATKDFVPALTHFRIKGGVIRGFNGNLALEAPIALDFDIAPHAVQMITAINACEEDKPIALYLDKGKRLVVVCEAFRSFVDCIDMEEVPEVPQPTERLILTADLMPALKLLSPFLATDASRPWACGLLLDHTSAFATNNIILLEYWLGFKFPKRINIPAMAVNELLRIGENPTALRYSDSRLVFEFSGDRQLSTQLYSSDWPDVKSMLERESSQTAFPTGFFDALKKIRPLCDEFGKCYFSKGCVSTVEDPDQAGASIETLGLPDGPRFNIDQLRRLEDIADTIDFGAYPNPSVFYGPKVRGLIVGFRI